MNNSLGFFLTIISGLFTIIGIIPIFIKIKDTNSFIKCSLSFSSGVMFSVSVFDLLPESIICFSNKYSFMVSLVLFIFLFSTGFIISKLINKNIKIDNSLYKVGIVSMIAIIMHNIPEGILTYMATSINTKLGISLTIAIAMHNIPEGISIAVPIYYSTYNKFKSFLFVLISALSEPIGAFISFIFFSHFVNEIVLGVIFSLVCGIMIYISLFELLQESKKYNWFVIGVIFMFIILKI